MSVGAENLPRASAAAPPFDEDDLTRFDYRGQTILGDAANYYIYARDEDDALRQLEDARIDVETVTRHRAPARRRRKFGREDLATFSLQLSDRVKSGESLIGAVLEIGRASRHNLLREALADIAAELRREGARPADAFRLRPDVFPRAFTNIIQIGTKKGDISDVLTKYGEAQLRAAENFSRLKGALYYPATIVGLAIVIVAVMCYVILPKMEEFYASLLPLSRGELPQLTAWLLGASRFATSTLGIIVALACCAAAIYAWRWARGDGRETIERNSLHWPGVGALLRKFHSAYLIHLMSIMVGAGVTPGEILREAAEAATNVVYREKLEAIREAFHRGGLELQVAFAPYAFLFGDELQAVIATGERTGRLETQLAAYAALLDRRVQETITNLSKMIEPLTLIVAGVIIGLIVVAAYLPLFTLIGGMSASG